MLEILKQKVEATENVNLPISYITEIVGEHLELQRSQDQSDAGVTGTNSEQGSDDFASAEKGFGPFQDR